MIRFLQKLLEQGGAKIKLPKKIFDLELLSVVGEAETDRSVKFVQLISLRVISGIIESYVKFPSKGIAVLNTRDIECSVDGQSV
jgi:hypothetical protein